MTDSPNRRRRTVTDELIRTIAIVAIAVALWVAVIFGFNI